jgi:hypothetical protein
MKRFDKYLLCLIYLFSHFCLFSQNTTNVLPEKISNQKTIKHISIPGTKIFLVPPSGFKAATAFTGLQNTDANINVFDFPGTSYFKTSPGICRDSFEHKGAIVFEFKELRFNGYPAKFMLLQGDNHQRSYSLVFGDSTFSVLLLGTFPEGNTETGSSIRSSLLTAVYDKFKKTDPMETAIFRTEGQKSAFRFAKNNSGFYIYSRGGVIKTDYGDEPYMILSEAPYDTSKTLKTMCEETVLMMQKHGLMNFTIEKSGSVTVNGCPAYEAEITGFVKGQKTWNYLLVVRLKKGKTLLIQGISKKDPVPDLAEMRKLAFSIRSK